MSDENQESIEDEFESLEFDDTDPFEDFESGSEGGISELIRNNPLAKIGVVLGALAVVFVGVTLLGGDKDEIKTSRAAGTAKVKQAPGEEVSPAYREQIEEVNVEMVEEAVRQRKSAIPIPVVTADSDRVQVQESEAQEEDPLERWRRIQEERQQREELRRRALTGSDEKVAAVDPLAQQQANSEMLEEMANAMATQMQTILQTLDPKSSSHMKVSAADYIEIEKEKELQKLQQQQATATAAGTTGGQGGTAEAEPVNILIPAGEIEYAQMILEANSDTPGPILALLASGPLSGSRMIGSFETQEKKLILRFNTIVVDGISQGIDAIAVDPATTSTGLVTDIDNRYFKRIILPAAASFIQGLGEAIAESGSTTVTVDGGAAVSSQNDLDTKEEVFSALSDAADTAGSLITEETSGIEPMIKVAAGTPMGILFLQPVLEPQSN